MSQRLLQPTGHFRRRSLSLVVGPLDAMRTFQHLIATMGLLSVLICGCSKQPVSQVAGSAETNVLSFYVVSDTAIPGGRYIDTPEFPKLGHISNAPSFIVTRLREVETNDVTTVSVMDNVVSTNVSPAVVIRMFQKDSESFAEFTRQNIDRKVLLMLRGKPLLAPMVRAPIETGSVQLPLLPKSVIEDIQKLVRHE